MTNYLTSPHTVERGKKNLHFQPHFSWFSNESEGRHFSQISQRLSYVDSFFA